MSEKRLNDRQSLAASRFLVFTALMPIPINRVQQCGLSTLVHYVDLRTLGEQQIYDRARPPVAADISAVRRVKSLALTFAPCARRAWTTFRRLPSLGSCHLPATACSKADFPSMLTLTSTPFASRSSTISTRPIVAADISAVLPNISTAFISAPASSKTSTICVPGILLQIAFVSAVPPSSAPPRTCGSAPFARRASTRSVLPNRAAETSAGSPDKPQVFTSPPPSIRASTVSTWPSLYAPSNPIPAKSAFDSAVAPVLSVSATFAQQQEGHRRHR